MTPSSTRSDDDAARAEARRKGHDLGPTHNGIAICRHCRARAIIHPGERPYGTALAVRCYAAGAYRDTDPDQDGDIDVATPTLDSNASMMPGVGSA